MAKEKDLFLLIDKGPKSGYTLPCSPSSCTTVGRARSNALQIRDAGVSQRHFSILWLPQNGPSQGPCRPDDANVCASRCSCRGRPTSAPRINDGVNAHHQHGIWTVMDEGSSNGTILNGAMIGPRSRVPLSNGDVIKIGQETTIQVVISTREYDDGCGGNGNDVPKTAAMVVPVAAHTGHQSIIHNAVPAAAIVDNNLPEAVVHIVTNESMGIALQRMAAQPDSAENDGAVNVPTACAVDASQNSAAPGCGGDGNDVPKAAIMAIKTKQKAVPVVGSRGQQAIIGNVMPETAVHNITEGLMRIASQRMTVQPAAAENNGAVNLARACAADVSSGPAPPACLDVTKGLMEIAWQRMTAQPAVAEDDGAADVSRDPAAPSCLDDMTVGRWIDHMVEQGPRYLYKVSEALIQEIKVEAHLFEKYVSSK